VWRRADKAVNRTENHGVSHIHADARSTTDNPRRSFRIRADGGKRPNVPGLTRLCDHRSFGPLERWRRRQSGVCRATVYSQLGPNSLDRAAPGFDALSGLRKSIGAGGVQCYRHRQEAVPWIGRSKNGRLFRRPRTTNERRAHFCNNATEEILQSYGVVLKLRKRRDSDRLPNAHDDLSLRYQRSWKEHRGAQRKTGGCINRRIHSPPFCRA
jgi:hypothetical protein